ncbi:MAG: diacylglycerol kinase [Gammaproteobacteria bacterium]|nr:diacylglycerol kinase [Gammaproteobacteria bacterium]
MAGLRDAWRFEEAFRIETTLFLILTPLGIYLGQTPIERVLLVGSLLIVLVTELLNSGIEATVDRVGEEHHLLSGRAKDIGSAAVFVALLNVVMTWGMILVPRI